MNAIFFREFHIAYIDKKDIKLLIKYARIFDEQVYVYHLDKHKSVIRVAISR